MYARYHLIKEANICVSDQFQFLFNRTTISIPFLIIVIGMCTIQSQPLASSFPCALEKALSIDELYATCGVPGDCSVPMACEGHRCQLRGYVSHVNIWDKRTYPWLPENKFLLYNSTQNLNIEVRVTSDSAPQIFDRLTTQSASWNGAVSLTGILVGIDLPILTGCHRSLVALITQAESLSILGKGGDAVSDKK